MKKIILLLLILSFPIACHAQFFGIGGQYAQHSDGQFVASLAIPTFHKKNKLNTFVTSGVEYTTGNAKITGLNIKPISINTFLSERMANSMPFTLLLGMDAGYNINLTHGKSGIVFTPNLYLDYNMFFVKAGYDFDVTNAQQQFFVRAGFCFGIGTIKHYAYSEIW